MLVSWFNQRLSTELQNTRTAHGHLLEAQDDLESALARQVAAALDADFRQLEIIPQSVAALLACAAQAWEEKELEAWLRTLVEKNKRIFGIAVAFEPHKFHDGREYEDFCSIRP